MGKFFHFRKTEETAVALEAVHVAKEVGESLGIVSIFTSCQHALFGILQELDSFGSKALAHFVVDFELW